MRNGILVVHPDYGIGTFRRVLDGPIRIAVVNFRGRGERRIILPSRRLAPIRASFAKNRERSSDSHPATGGKEYLHGQ